ncbi:MAG: NUDIX hydrolase [Haliea sp.]|uniref:NUDIX hydrolase n=1 Tax=Haliea sp. TaxID=1932666 RepID=UPI0032EFE31C
MTASVQVRDAATVILVRDRATRPRVLMGQRGARAVFMPSKFVFPGGAVDPGDALVPLAGKVGPVCSSRLAEGAAAERVHALQAAAIREVWEESGLLLGTPGDWAGPVPDDWQEFCATGYLPCAAAFRYVFRAITPVGPPRRFDARFFLVDASAVAGDPDDFSRASEELSQLQWIALDETGDLDLPLITEVVLGEVARVLACAGPPPEVPCFRDEDEQRFLLRRQAELLLIEKRRVRGG